MSQEKQPPILFEVLFGKTTATSILSHFVEFEGFAYTIHEVSDILSLDKKQVAKIISDFVEQNILLPNSDDPDNKKFTFIAKYNKKTLALEQYQSAALDEIIDSFVGKDQ